MRNNIVINVNKPKEIDGGILDTIFGKHQAIADAEILFWDMKLARKAILGEVKTTNTGYSVEILY